MKIICLTGWLLLFCLSASAQKTFELKDASKYFDVKISVAKCDNYACQGEASFSIYKKGGNAAFEVINLSDTYLSIRSNGSSPVNQTLLYKEQGAVIVGDFNFDGMEDLAICDGHNGNYADTSYQVYLSSRSAGKFLHDQEFSELGQHSGMFDVDEKRKILRTLDKSGCCRHITEEYTVIKNRPVKIFVEEEDLGFYDEKSNQGKTKITTKRLIKGKWQIKVKYQKHG